MKLRPYQEQAIASVERAFKRGAPSALLVACTGAGKTIISSSLMSERRKRRKKCLFLAHREELLTQTKEKMASVDPEAVVEIAQGANHASRNADIMVASVQTLYQDLERITKWCNPEDFELCITDECHHATATTYRQIYEFLAGWAPHFRSLGITATPKRPDGANLSEVFQELVYQINMFDLIDQGFLTPIRGKTIHSTISLKTVDTIKRDDDGFNDYDENMLRLTVDCPVRNRLVVDSYLQHGENRKAIFFTVSVGHAENLCAILRSEGVVAEAVSGDMPKEKRRSILKRFYNGEIKVLANCALLVEGFDDPTVECVVVARPTQSHVLYPQMVGRGVRLDQNNPTKTCLVIDIVDRDGKETQTLSGLFELPPRITLKGEDIAKLREEARRVVKAHPLVAWKAGDDFSRNDLMRLLAPSTLFEVAQSIEPLTVGEYLWLRVGVGKWAIAMSDAGWAVVEREGDNFLLSIESATIYKFPLQDEKEVLLKAAAIVRELHPDSYSAMAAPNAFAFKTPPTKNQIQLLAKRYRIPQKELNVVKSKGEATTVLARLSISARLCQLDNRFPSGKYFRFSIPLIYFFDPEYVKQQAKGNASVRFFLEDRRRIVDWLHTNKPLLMQEHVYPHVSAARLNEVAASDEEKFRSSFRQVLSHDLEYKALLTHQQAA